MVNGVTFGHLTRKHGFKVNASFPCSVEDIGLAVGEQVGHGSVRSAARMNGAVVIFLDQVEKVNRVVETGITVKQMFVQVVPLTRVILSNVPPFITDEFLSRELSRHGKVVSPIKKIMSGCRSQLLKHVVSHRRQLFMILNNRDTELNLRFHVKVDDYDYVIFATSSAMKCFRCNEEGHTVKACPRHGDPTPPGRGVTLGTVAEPSAAPPVAAERREAAAPQPSAAAEISSAAARAAASERPIAAPRSAPPLAAAVSDREHGGVSMDDVHGVSEDDQIGEGEVLGDGVAESGAGEETAEKSVSEVYINNGGVSETQGGLSEEEEIQAEETGMGGSKPTWGEQVEEAELEEEEEEAVKAKTASKRRGKTRTKQEAKSSKVEDRQTVRGQTEESESDECVSDSSDISGFKVSNSQQKKLYSVELIQSFLTKTKNAKGVKMEEHFPVLSLFYTSARLHMSKKDESGFTDQEVFRLRKLLPKVKRQMNKDDDGKNSSVCFK